MIFLILSLPPSATTKKTKKKKRTKRKKPRQNRRKKSIWRRRESVIMRLLIPNMTFWFFFSFFLSPSIFFIFLTFIFLVGSCNHQHSFCHPSKVPPPSLSTLLLIFYFSIYPILNIKFQRKIDLLSHDDIAILFCNVEVMAQSLKLLLQDLRTSREEENINENLGIFFFPHLVLNTIFILVSLLLLNKRKHIYEAS